MTVETSRAEAPLLVALERLVGILPVLEEAGEYAAAAHVAAAIDVLEAKLDLAAADLPDGSGGNSVTTIAKALVDVFGDRAGTVARRQLDGARGASFLAWASIINRMAD